MALVPRIKRMDDGSLGYLIPSAFFEEEGNGSPLINWERNDDGERVIANPQTAGAVVYEKLRNSLSVGELPPLQWFYDLVPEVDGEPAEWIVRVVLPDNIFAERSRAAAVAEDATEAELAVSLVLAQRLKEAAFSDYFTPEQIVRFDSLIGHSSSVEEEVHSGLILSKLAEAYDGVRETISAYYPDAEYSIDSLHFNLSDSGVHIECIFSMTIHIPAKEGLPAQERQVKVVISQEVASSDTLPTAHLEISGCSSDGEGRSFTTKMLDLVRVSGEGRFLQSISVDKVAVHKRAALTDFEMERIKNELSSSSELALSEKVLHHVYSFPVFIQQQLRSTTGHYSEIDTLKIAIIEWKKLCEEKIAADVDFLLKDEEFRSQVQGLLGVPPERIRAELIDRLVATAQDALLHGRSEESVPILQEFSGIGFFIEGLLNGWDIDLSEELPALASKIVAGELDYSALKWIAEILSPDLKNELSKILVQEVDDEPVNWEEKFFRALIFLDSPEQKVALQKFYKVFGSRNVLSAIYWLNEQSWTSDQGNVYFVHAVHALYQMCLQVWEKTPEKPREMKRLSVLVSALRDTLGRAVDSAESYLVAKNSVVFDLQEKLHRHILSRAVQGAQNYLKLVCSDFDSKAPISTQVEKIFQAAQANPVIGGLRNRALTKASVVAACKILAVCEAVPSQESSQDLMVAVDVLREFQEKLLQSDPRQRSAFTRSMQFLPSLSVSDGASLNFTPTVAAQVVMGISQIDRAEWIVDPHSRGLFTPVQLYFAATSPQAVLSVLPLDRGIIVGSGRLREACRNFAVESALPEFEKYYVRVIEQEFMRIYDLARKYLVHKGEIDLPDWSSVATLNVADLKRRLAEASSMPFEWRQKDAVVNALRMIDVIIKWRDGKLDDPNFTSTSQRSVASMLSLCTEEFNRGDSRSISWFRSGHSQLYKDLERDGVVVRLRTFAQPIGEDVRAVPIIPVTHPSRLEHPPIPPSLPRWVAERTVEGAATGGERPLAQEMAETTIPRHGEPSSRHLRRPHEGPERPADSTHLPRPVSPGH